MANEITYGSEYVFNTATSYYTSTASLNGTTFVAVYQDTGNSNRGTAIIGTVSGTTISYGSEYVFHSSGTTYCNVIRLTDTSFVVVFRGASNYGRARIGTVSGTVITYGTEFVFYTGSTTYTCASRLSDTSFVVAYTGGFSYGRSKVCTVLGTDISAGSEYTFNSGITSSIAISSLSSGAIVIAYQDQGNSYVGTAIIGTISGTVITYGSEYVFQNSEANLISVVALSSTNFVISYYEVITVQSATLIGGSVSTTTITYGTANTFDTGIIVGSTSLSLLPNDKIVMSYNNNDGVSDSTRCVIADVSGTTLTVSNYYEVQAAQSTYASVSYMSSGKFVLVFCDVGNSSYGTGIIGTYPTGKKINNVVLIKWNGVAISKWNGI